MDMVSSQGLVWQCMGFGLCPLNHLGHQNTYPEQEPSRTLLQPSEVTAFMQACEAADRQSAQMPITAVPARGIPLQPTSSSSSSTIAATSLPPKAVTHTFPISEFVDRRGPKDKKKQPQSKKIAPKKKAKSRPKTKVDPNAEANEEDVLAMLASEGENSDIDMEHSLSEEDEEEGKELKGARGMR